MSVLVCPCLSLSVLVCPCLSLYVYVVLILPPNLNLLLTLSLPAYHCRQWNSWCLYASPVAKGLIIFIIQFITYERCNPMIIIVVFTFIFQSKQRNFHQPRGHDDTPSVLNWTVEWLNYFVFSSRPGGVVGRRNHTRLLDPRPLDSTSQVEWNPHRSDHLLIAQLLLFVLLCVSMNQKVLGLNPWKAMSTHYIFYSCIVTHGIHHPTAVYTVMYLPLGPVALPAQKMWGSEQIFFADEQ